MLKLFTNRNANGLWKLCNTFITMIYAIRMLFAVSDGIGMPGFIIDILKTMAFNMAWSMIASMICLVVISITTATCDVIADEKKKKIKNEIGFH